MCSIDDLRCLFNYRQSRADWHFLLTFTDSNLTCLTELPSRLFDPLCKSSKTRPWFLVRHWHYGILNTLSWQHIYWLAAARRNANLIFQLATGALRIQKPWEIAEHACIGHFSPHCGKRRRSIAKQMDETQAIKTQAAYQRELSEKLLR